MGKVFLLPRTLIWILGYWKSASFLDQYLSEHQGSLRTLPIHGQKRRWILEELKNSISNTPNRREYSKESPTTHKYDVSLPAQNPLSVLWIFRSQSSIVFEPSIKCLESLELARSISLDRLAYSQISSQIKRLVST